MKLVILAGGLGTRLSEETHINPKPMVEIGVKPILWHIMKFYSTYGFEDFIICCGYKGDVIKKFFYDYSIHGADFQIDLSSRAMRSIGNARTESWRVSLVDTGVGTGTAGRLKLVERLLGPEETFCFTYGDGLSNINIKDLIAFHTAHGKLATVTAARPPGRYGIMSIENDGRISTFSEKPLDRNGWVNAGFFVLNRGVFDYISESSQMWEAKPMEMLAQAGELFAYQHSGFWQPMDTLREKNLLNDMWNSGNAPWKIW